jgi:DNA modification methylase
MLPTLSSASVQCCVTSPPYFGLRDYGVDGQIGLEKTPDAYVAELVVVFREVRRVLRDDGVLFLNLGDSYCSTDKWGGGVGGNNGKHVVADDGEVPSWAVRSKKQPMPGIKPKDLIGIPWMVAFALRVDGWWLRSSIIWAKPNPMPESCRDRPTSSYENVFLLAKSARYFWDAEAVAEPLAEASIARLSQDVENQRGSNRANGGRKTNGPMRAVGGLTDKQSGHGRRHAGFNDRWDAAEECGATGNSRNVRNVWTIATQPYAEAHFATFPPELADRCIKAGSRPGDTILDPFSGAGTTSLVADRLGRHAIGIDLNEDYGAMARRRVVDDCPLFAEVEP